MQTNSTAIKLGAELVASFEAVMINKVGAAVSAAEATESEQMATDTLRYFGGGNVLNPSLIPAESNARIARASVDAHIKKIQAAQYEALSSAQLADIQATTQKYTNKPITIRVLDRDSKPIESVWFSAKKGYYTGVVNTGQLKAVVEEVWFDKNAILLKPRRVSRLLEPNRKNYILYIVNPDTLQPMVELELV